MNTQDDTKRYLTEDIKARENDLYAYAKYEIIKQWLSQEKKLTILDVGCGSGDLAAILAKEGHRLTGIDSESQFISLAKQKIQATTLDCTFSINSLEQYQPDQKFDCTVSTDVIEHISDDQAAMKKIAELTKKNGSIIIAVPALPWLYGYHDTSIGHYRRYSLSDIKQLIKNVADIEQAQYFGWTFIPICILFSKILKKQYPLNASGNSKSYPLATYILKMVLLLDKIIPMPFGTSILIKARKR